jgi:hypothetical protein
VVSGWVERGAFPSCGGVLWIHRSQIRRPKWQGGRGSCVHHELLLSRVTVRGANPKKPLGATPPKNQNSTPPLQWGSHKKIKKRVPHTPLVLMRCARPFSDALAAQPLTLILTLPASHHEDHSRTRHVDRRSHTDSCTIGTRNSLYSAAQHAAKTTVRAHSLGAQTPL